ncbi:MAG: DUF2079 domain-containing protein [Planctomycetota bacterium]|nr:MAG: DUF2079 domain-containing protein [Planctomycetota bacterium]
MRRAVLWWLAGAAGAGVGLRGMLESALTAGAFFSSSTWLRCVQILGGALHRAGDEAAVAEVPLAPLCAGLAAISACWALVPVVAMAVRRRTVRGGVDAAAGRRWEGGPPPWVEWAVTAGVIGRWLLIVLAWEVFRLAAALAGSSAVLDFLAVSPSLFVAAALAGSLAAIATRCACGAALRSDRTFGQADAPSGTAGAARAEHGDAERVGECAQHAVGRRVRWALWGAVVAYVVVFGLMNWRLWVCLRIPHGDSAMYEEHLWNVLHGKGFRSYLDQGLFLGEHIQVVHLLLLPLYWLWPHHMLLELSESIALAVGAVAVFRIAERAGGRAGAALALSVAYLLYFPLEYLDIAVDLKTFRPISFGVPLLLFAIDQWERRRFGVAALLIVLTLSCKEDFAIVLAGWGAWIAARAWWRRQWRADERGSANGARASGVVSLPSADGDAARGPLAYGVVLAVGSAVYLWLATRVVIPWFRGGEEVHYARYFSRFGSSLTEIAWNMLTHPGIVLSELFSVGGVLYALLILLPLAFVPLASPGRLSTGLPLFVLLCLNEIARDPRHHFHAPLLPIVFWAAAWGLARLQDLLAGGTAAGAGGGGAAVAVSRSIAADARQDDGWSVARRERAAGGGWLARALFALVAWGTGLVPASARERRLVASFPAHLVWAAALATGVFWSIAPWSIAFWDPGSHWYWRRLYVADERVAEFERIFPMIPRDARVASTDYIHPRFTHHRRSYDYSHYRRKVAGYRDTVPPDTDFIVIDCRGPYAEIQRPEQVPELQRYPQCWNVVPEATSEYFIVLRRNWRACPVYPPDEAGAAEGSRGQ